MRRLGCALLLACLPGAVHAQEQPPGRRFPSLDRAGGASAAGIDLAIQWFEDSNSDGGQVDDQAYRLDLHVELAPWEDTGFTASLPLVALFDEVRGAGAAQLGAYHRLRVASGHDLLLRAGVQLPTDGFVPEESYFTDVATRAVALQRVEDPALSSGDVWVRLGGSYRLESGPVRAQVDLFADLPPAPGDELDPDRSGSPLRLLAGAGIGYQRGRFGGGLELVVSSAPDIVLPDTCYGVADVWQATFCDTTFAVLAASARWQADPQTALFLWYSEPLDDGLRYHEFHIVGMGAQRGF
jgi:hypothetical protein